MENVRRKTGNIKRTEENDAEYVAKTAKKLGENLRSLFPTSQLKTLLTKKIQEPRHLFLLF